MSKSQITISSQDSNNLSLKAGRFIWPRDFSMDHKIDPDLSFRVFGDDVVVTVLHKAFELGLSRRLSWDISSVEPPAKKALVIASRIFKRGVPISDAAEVKQPSSLSHDVSFKSDLLSCFSSIGKRDVIIADSNVSRYWWHQLPSGFIPYDFNEGSKNLNAVADVMDRLRSSTRSDSTVYVVGGGVAGDVVGFAAGLLGLRCQYVPTTLLAMVDSTIGGKVGVNFEPWGKNQIGLFHAPAAVSIWTGWLSTLPEKEILSGLAEALKHAILSGNRDLWRNLTLIAREKSWSKLSDDMAEIIAFKRAVVDRDPLEKSERAILNFGHTLGHVIETLCHQKGFHVTHGECVALGMVHALRLSEKYKGMKASAYIESLLTCAVVPDSSRLEMMLGSESLFDEYQLSVKKLLLGDKKSSCDDSVSLVLLKEFGEVARSEGGQWTVSIPMNQAWLDIRDTWQFLLAPGT